MNLKNELDKPENKNNLIKTDILIDQNELDKPEDKDNIAKTDIVNKKIELDKPINKDNLVKTDIVIEKNDLDNLEEKDKLAKTDIVNKKIELDKPENKVHLTKTDIVIGKNELNNQENKDYLTKTDIVIEKNELDKQENKDNLAKTEIENKIIKCKYENKIYLMINPHFIDFEFPNNIKRSIFISDLNQLIFLLKNYKNYTKFYYKNETEPPFENIIPKNVIPYEKIVLKLKIPNTQEYEYANKHVEAKKIYSKDLSLNFMEYFENCEYVNKQKPYFEYSKERQNFFHFLNEELNRKSFIGICGPEGIGKTASILAFCKINYFQTYFYFNIKAMIKNMDDIKKIVEIISNEFVHCLEEKYILEYVELLQKNISSFETPLDILIYIIKNCRRFNPHIIVIDQYKIKYDKDYKKLKELYLLQKDFIYSIIFISSINEEDVKSSIISILKGDNIFINYIYVSKLIEVTEKDRKLLDKTELDLLDGFGNYYFIYYLILKEKKNYKKIDNLTFEDYFINKMDQYYQNGLEKYFGIKDSDKIIDKIKFLFMETGKNIKIKTFLENSENIPFRFFKFTYNGNNFFNLTGLSKSNDIYMEYQSDYVIICLFNYYKANLIEKKEYLTSNNDINLNSIKLEDSISLYLWAMRNKSPIEGLYIYDFIIIDSIFEPKEKDIDLLKSKIAEIKNKEKSNLGILIHNLNQNALYFDTCILKIINKDEFEIYFFQTTIKKTSKERFTLIFLNENLSYISDLYQLRLGIKISKFYYYYIFDDKIPDLQTMQECSNNFIDYLKFNTKTYLFSSKNKINLLQYKLKERLFLYSDMKLPKDDSIIEINKMDLDDIEENQKEEKLKKTHEFLDKKRKLISQKEKPKEYLKILLDYKNYYKTITKNDKYEMNYDEKDSLYNEYLSNQKDIDCCNLPGITYKINSSSIKSLITKYLSPLTKDQIFNIIGIPKDNYEIISIKFVKNILPYVHKPKKGNYLFMKYNDKDLFYFDYSKNKKINISDPLKEETDFDGIYQKFSKYYIISILQKNLIYSK